MFKFYISCAPFKIFLTFLLLTAPAIVSAQYSTVKICPTETPSDIQRAKRTSEMLCRAQGGDYGPWESNSNLMRMNKPATGYNPADICNIIRRYPTGSGNNYAWRAWLDDTGPGDTVLNLQTEAAFHNFKEKTANLNTCVFDTKATCRNVFGQTDTTALTYNDCASIFPRNYGQADACPVEFYDKDKYIACVSNACNGSDCVNVNSGVRALRPHARAVPV